MEVKLNGEVVRVPYRVEDVVAFPGGPVAYQEHIPVLPAGNWIDVRTMGDDMPCFVTGAPTVGN